MLIDKVALVTGAGTGIGRAIALALADAGADVAVSDIDEDAALGTADAIAAMGRRTAGIRADCGDLGDIDAMVARTVGELGRLDVIVNNAGISRSADIMDLTVEDWDRMHRLNAKGVFFCMQRAARQMVAQGTGGRVINLGSVAGRAYAGTSNAAYAASKGAVIAMTKTAAQQLGRHGINVNAICPGVTLTDLVSRLMTERGLASNRSHDEVLAAAEKNIPIGRANTPEDIAGLAVFLAGPGAANVTGQAWMVDGGLVPS